MDQAGLHMFVGPLEAQILSVLWDHQQPMSATEIHRSLLIDYNGKQAYNTIFTTINRMLDKKLLFVARRSTRRSTPTPTYAAYMPNEQAFIIDCLVTSLDRFHREYPSAFMDLLAEYFTRRTNTDDR